MPRFKVRDLMIHLPDERQTAQQACVQPSVANRINLTPTPTLCFNGTCIAGTPIHCITGTIHCGGITFTCINGSCFTGTPITCFTGTVTCFTGSGTCFTGSGTCFTGSGTCTPSFTDTTPITELTPVIDPVRDVRQVADLDALREQLKGALAQVEEQARLRDEQLAPRTAEEFDALEQQLQGALEELKARRANLKQ